VKALKSESKLLIINYPPKYPKSVHLYITNECNLDCEKCYYRKATDPKQELTLEQLRGLFEEWQRYKLTSIAIGGGDSQTPSLKICRNYIAIPLFNCLKIIRMAVFS